MGKTKKQKGCCNLSCIHYMRVLSKNRRDAGCAPYGTGTGKPYFGVEPGQNCAQEGDRFYKSKSDLEAETRGTPMSRKERRIILKSMAAPSSQFNP